MEQLHVETPLLHRRAFVVLTVTGIWFRGSGMALCWPWDRGAVAGLSIFTGGP